MNLSESNFVNYLVSCHGIRIEDDFITLPPGIRVVMLCSDTTCPISNVANYSVARLMLNNDFDPTLLTVSNLIKKAGPRMNKRSMCVFSGNIDDRFRYALENNGCTKKQMNIIPNLSFSEEDRNRFKDGIYKIPINPTVINKRSQIVMNRFHDLENVISVLKLNDDTEGDQIKIDRMHNGPGIVFMKNTDHNYELKINSQNDYLTFRPNGINPKAPQNLRQLIDLLKVSNNFDNTDKMITIIIVACVGNTGKFLPELCTLTIEEYFDTVVSITRSNGTTCMTSLVNYDINKRNNYNYDFECDQKACELKSNNLNLNYDDIINKLNSRETQNMIPRIKDVRPENIIRYDQKPVVQVSDKQEIEGILTTFINENFFKNEMDGLNFLDIITSEFTKAINLYIEKNIINGLKKGDIIFVYKGGNLLRNITDIFKKEYPNSIFNHIQDKFKKIFGKSDYDFSIYINPKINNYDQVFDDMKFLSYIIIKNLVFNFTRNKQLYFDYFKRSADNKKCALEEYLDMILKANAFKDQNNKTLYNFIPTKILLEDIYTTRNHNNNRNYQINFMSDDVFATNISSKRNSIAIQNFENQDIGAFKINDMPQNDFYISVNEAIRFVVTRPGEGQNAKIIKFVLLRAKVNFLISGMQDNTLKKMNFGGELIDISIPHRTSDGIQIFFDHIQDNIQTYSIHNNNIYGYSNKYLIKDLNQMIFDMGVSPWQTQKFEKRIRRLMYLQVIEILKNITDNKKRIEYIKRVITCLDNISRTIEQNKAMNKDQYDRMISAFINSQIQPIIITFDNFSNFNTFILEILTIQGDKDDSYRKFVDLIKSDLEDIDVMLNKLDAWLQSNGTYKQDNLSLVGGEMRDYKQLYMKYKTKYLSLKNKY